MTLCGLRNVQAAPLMVVGSWSLKVWRGGAAGERLQWNSPRRLAHAGSAPGPDERRGACARRAAAVRRAGAPRLEVGDGPHPFVRLLLARACLDFEAANVQIVAAEVRSNGCDEPPRWTVFRLPSTPGRCFVARPRQGFGPCHVKRLAAAVLHVPSFAVPLRPSGRPPMASPPPPDFAASLPPIN